MSRLQRRVEYLETKLDLTRLELKPAGHIVDEPTFPFLRLPREVRNQIYLYALRCLLAHFSSSFEGNRIFYLLGFWGSLLSRQLDMFSVSLLAARVVLIRWYTEPAFSVSRD